MAIGDDDFSATTAVAVDKDKGSHQAVKWTLDHLVAGSNGIVILHVRTTPSARGDDAEISELFRTYRMFFAKKGIKTKEVLLEDADISRALLEYVHNHRIINIVLGASNRNAITRKFRHADVPSQLLKSAPNFCSVYVIWKGKTTDSKVARSQPSSSASFTPWVPPPSLTPSSTSLGYLESDDSIRSTAKGGWRAPLPPSAPAEWRSFGGGTDFPKMQLRDRPPSSARLASSPIDCLDIEPSTRPMRSRDSDDLDIHGSSDFGDLEFSLVPNGSSSGPSSPTSANREMEAEMRRLKLELKQTMDMYSNACKEAITAKQKAKELHQLKLEEARKFEEARQSEEAALAMAELEKARCKAAIEAAQAAQRAAEVEAQKRQNAEMAAKREAEEKKKALDFLAHNNMRYRKYTIDEIEVATEYFAEKLKIGEGGYGPVYQASLDHTPVAIKVLRPDAAQGRKQFQQEVEVLSCIRHPNMVLLLGACPEYGCLVYEFMDYGSLDDRLFRRGGTPPIPWQTRFKIAAEIATALLFLHQTKPEPLVHRDLKPANILLDRNFVSKISDVGLSRLVPPSVVDNVTQYRMTSTAGTFCYIDPEYQQTGMLGTKSDIYSLGILLLQIITARPPMAISHHVERAIDRGTFREMLDPAIEDCPLDEALAFAKIALACAQLRRKDRPDLGTVVLPELNRLRRLGVEKAEGGLGATLSPNVSRPNSGGVPSRAQSETNQEIIHSDSQMATGSKSVTGVETVSPSSSQG